MVRIANSKTSQAISIKMLINFKEYIKIYIKTPQSYCNCHWS